MILVDANLLVYAHVSSFEQHERTREWFDGWLSGPGPVGLPWPSLLGFVRLTSNPRIFERPMPVARAWAQAKAWLDRPNVWTPLPTEQHREVLDPLLAVVERSALVPDAHLAALAIEHGLTLYSTDGDFARFPGLRWENPLR
jgi:toxin-antitoxin system PIN domain toxin